MPKSVKNYETILPFSCCPLVFPWQNREPPVWTPTVCRPLGIVRTLCSRRLYAWRVPPWQSMRRKILRCPAMLDCQQRQLRDCRCISAQGAWIMQANLLLATPSCTCVNGRQIFILFWYWFLEWRFEENRNMQFMYFFQVLVLCYTTGEKSDLFAKILASNRSKA